MEAQLSSRRPRRWVLTYHTGRDVRVRQNWVGSSAPSLADFVTRGTHLFPWVSLPPAAQLGPNHPKVGVRDRQWQELIPPSAGRTEAALAQPVFLLRLPHEWAGSFPLCAPSHPRPTVHVARQ